jgi:hypothetical protein
MTVPKRKRRALAVPRLLAAALLGCLLAPAARADLVVLDDGRFYKVTAYELRGESVRLTLREGGRITLPLERVAHVVDDEWVPPEPEPEPAPESDRSWRFADGVAVPRVPYGREIYTAARRHGVDPELVAAVVRAESAFDARAVSAKGARGLMQLMPATARRFGLAPERAFDAAANVEAGTRYLAWLLERFEGNLALALAAYNAGEGTVERYGGVPPFRETRSYVRRVFETLGLTGPSLASG